MPMFTDVCCPGPHFHSNMSLHLQRHKVPVFTDDRCRDSRYSVSFFSAPDNNTSLAPINGGTYNQYSGDTVREYTDKLLGGYKKSSAIQFTE